MFEEKLWEKIMRFSPAAIALSSCLAVMSSVGLSKSADNQISPESLSLLAKGDMAMTSGKVEDAIGLYESALVVDPRHRTAYIALARAMRKQGLNGKAIRYFSEALELDPNDMTALSEQAETMVSKGALEPARGNLAKLRQLCRSDCGNIEKLAASIVLSGKKEALQAEAVQPKPVASQETVAKP